MRKEVSKWIKMCTMCQKHRKGKDEKKGLLKLIEAYLLFELMGIDILMNLNEMPNGYKHIIILTNYYIKWPEAFAVKDHLAKTLV